MLSLGESLIDGIIDIRSHLFRTLLQTIGIILGVASVVATFSLIESGRQESMKLYAETGGLNKLFVAPDWQAKTKLTALDRASKGLVLSDAEAIAEHVDGVTLIEPATGRRLSVGYSDFREDHYVQGVTQASAIFNKLTMDQGRFITDMDLDFRNRVAVLGSSIARQIFGAGDPVGKVISLGDHRFTVIGVMKEKVARFKGSQRNSLDYMNWWIFMPLTTMLQFYQGDKSIGSITVRFDEIAKHKEIQASIETLMRRRHGTDDVRVYNRRERIENYRKQSLAFEMVFKVTGAVSLLVGGIVIMNILLASFHERVREVGIRKALGATGFDITAQFLVESVLITIIGGLIGIVAGAILVNVISHVTQQPAYLTPGTVALAFAFSVMVGIFFGFYPAVKAARLDPIEALRYE